MKKLQKIVGGLVFIFMISLIGLWALDNMPTVAVDVGVVATEIVPANYQRQNLIIYNAGSATVYIDNYSVDCSTITSFDLTSGSMMVFDKYQGAIWGIVDTTTSTIKVIYLQY